MVNMGRQSHSHYRLPSKQLLESTMWPAFSHWNRLQNECYIANGHSTQVQIFHNGSMHFFLLGSLPFQLPNILALGKFHAFLGHLEILIECYHICHINRHIPTFRPPTHCIANPQKHFHDLQTLIKAKWPHGCSHDTRSQGLCWMQ
jgi:hypothetical protein